MKQTTVEFLEEQLFLNRKPTLNELLIIKEAKEMEKERIINAFKRGTINEMNGIEEINSEQYYNETFKNQLQG